MVAWPAMGIAPETPVAAGRSWVESGMLAGAAALLVGALFFGGGSGNASVLPLGALAAALGATGLGLACLGRLALPRLELQGRVAAASGICLLAWGGVTIAWSIAGDRSWDAVNKGLVYACFGLVGLLLAGRGRTAVADVASLVALLLGAALVWALAAKAIPGLHDDGGRATRLRYPVGHANGLALLAGAALVLGLWLAAGARGRRSRPAGTLLVYAGALALLLTQSRSGVVVAVFLVAAWLWVSSEWLEGALLGALAALPALVVAGWVFTRPALVEQGADAAARVADGRLFAALALAGAGVALTLSWRLPVARLVAGRRSAVRAGLGLGTAMILTAGLVAFVVSVGNPVSWAVDQVSGESGTEVVNDPSRFGSLNTNNRVAWWGEALEVFRDHPLGGSGANTFEVARKRYRADARTVSQPHNVGLQLLADSGLVGLGLGVVFAGSLGVAAVRGARRLEGREQSAAIALGALPAAWALHSLVDYNLDFVALTGPALLAAWALAGAGLPPVGRPSGRLPLAGVVLVALTLIGSLAATDLSRRGVDAAYRALDRGAPSRARARANAARELNPLSPEPLAALADIALELGDERLGLAYLVEATRLQPRNPDTWYQLGLTYQLALDDQCRAYGALNESYTLDPSSARWRKGGELDVARAAVDAGACER